MGNAGRIRVLHVDDEPDFADMVATVLERENDRFDITTANNVSDGLDRLAGAEFDCIVSDHDMPGKNGIEFLKAVREEYPDLPFILFTGKGSEEVASGAISAGVSDYLQKRSGRDRYGLLANRITNLVSQYRTEGQLETRVQQQQYVADLGNEALAGASLETLFDRAAELVADGLDNEYAQVFEYRPEHEDVLLRAGVGWRDGLVGEATVGTDEDSQPGHTLRSEQPIVVENLHTEDRFRAPPLLVEHDVVSGISVIIGSYDDPWGVLGTHTTEPTVFTDGDVTFVQNVANVLANAINREERDIELRQKERRYQAVFNDPNILVGLLDTDGTVLDINRTAMEYIDAPLSDITDTPFWKTPWFNHSEAVQTDVREWIENAASGQYVEFEVDLVRPDGEQYTVEGVFRPVTNDDGEVVSLLISDRDITEQKERERDLERARSRMELALGVTGAAVWEWDLETDAVTMHPERDPVFETELRTVDDFIEKLHPEDRSRVQEALEAAAETESSYDVEYRVQADETVRWVAAYGEMQYGDDGDARRMVGVARDITEWKQREQQLEAEQRKFRSLVDVLPHGVYRADPETMETSYANEEFEQIHGYQAGELRDTPDLWEQALHPDDASTVKETFRTHYESRDPGQLEYRIRTTDGDTRWVEDTFQWEYDDAGNVTALVGAYIDITEQKEREQEYERLLELLRHTERIADVGGWEITPETRDVFWSEHLFEMQGWDDDDEEPPLEEALDVYVEEDRPRVTNAVKSALAAGESFGVEARFRRLDGEIRWFDIRGKPTIEDGEVVTVRGAVHDITDRKRRERVLREIHDIISNRHHSFEEQVQALLGLGRRELGTEYGTVSEIRGEEYVFKFVDADDDSIKPGDVVPVSATNCEIVASTEQTLVIGDIERDAPEETDRAGFTEWSISCYIGAPVFVEDEVYGTFCFYGTEARADQFSEWEQTLVDLMSDWVSHEFQRGQVNERLREQNEQLEQFTDIVSHDLRNPLTVAQGNLELAREECDSDHLDDVGRAHERIAVLIADLLTLAREGETVGEFESVDLGSVSESCWRTAGTAEATLAIEVERTIRADSSRL